MTEMNLNTDTYALAGSATHSEITLTPQDANQAYLVILNTDTTYPMFVVSSSAGNTGASAVAAVIPTAGAGNQKGGKMIGPGMMATFTKRTGDEFVSVIWAGAATGNAYISAGVGY